MENHKNDEIDEIDEDGDTYTLVEESEMTLEEYPCGLKAGEYIAPYRDIEFLDENGQASGIHLKANTRCMVLTGHPKEPDVIWYRNCGTGEVATWDDSIMNDFYLMPPLPQVKPEDLIGKKVLIGLRRYDKDGNHIANKGYFGKITAVKDNTVWFFDENEGEQSVPFKPGAFSAVEPESDFVDEIAGLPVTGADFISHWKVYPDPE